MNTMKNLTCSFSGHRSIYRIHTDTLLPKLSETLDTLIDAGYTHFCSGGARGFDLLAAHEVLKKRDAGHKITLTMLLPCRDQVRNWPKVYRELHAYVLKKADEVIYVNEKYDQFCMHARNRRLVDDGDILLCYMMHKSSGTGYTYNYACDRNVKILNLADLLAE